ncbi:hypothetical protein BDW66DRAFT_132192 [Aspergillus desertorum]
MRLRGSSFSFMFHLMVDLTGSVALFPYAAKQIPTQTREPSFSTHAIRHIQPNSEKITQANPSNNSDKPTPGDKSNEPLLKLLGASEFAHWLRKWTGLWARSRTLWRHSGAYRRDFLCDGRRSPH